LIEDIITDASDDLTLKDLITSVNPTLEETEISRDQREANLLHNQLAADLSK
jgi:hypothetical protein